MRTKLLLTVLAITSLLSCKKEHYQETEKLEPVVLSKDGEPTLRVFINYENTGGIFGCFWSGGNCLPDIDVTYTLQEEYETFVGSNTGSSIAAYFNNDGWVNLFPELDYNGTFCNDALDKLRSGNASRQDTIVDGLRYFEFSYDSHSFLVLPVSE